MDSLSGITTSTSTTLPPEIIYERKDERNLNASKIILKENEALEPVQDELVDVLDSFFERKKETYFIQKDRINVFFDCKFIGSQIGGERHSIDMEFDLKWKQIKDSFDRKVLLSEFERLIEKLMKRAQDNENYIEIGHVATAMEELKKDNGQGMVKHLKQAGNWALDTAKEIGTEVLVRLLKNIMQ